MLIGDAGHLTNPTGGLGLTTGLYDVLALEELREATQQMREITSTLDGRQTMLMGLDSPRSPSLLAPQNS